MNSHYKRYRFRIYPTKKQEKKMLAQAGACRWVWNWALEQQNKSYKITQKLQPTLKLDSQIAQLKKQEDTKWLKECESQSLKYVLRNLDEAYKAAFRRLKNGIRCGLPKWKTKHKNRPSFSCTQGVKINGNRIKVGTEKIGWVKIKLHRPIENFGMATFKQNSVGHWHVTLTSKFEIPNAKLMMANEERIVGIDFGLIDFAVFSDESDPIPAPKFYRKLERKLGIANKAFHRSKKGSKREAKKRFILAKIHNKIKGKRYDFLNKLSTTIVNKFGGVCVESLNLKGLVRTKLAKSFYDASHGMFKEMLKYKCLWYLKTFMDVDRFYPSSRMCNVCKSINKNLSRNDREWVCSSCNRFHNRDKNAALNIKNEGWRLIQLAAGYADKQNARGVDVRPKLVNQVEAIDYDTRTTKSQDKVGSTRFLVP